VSNLKTFATRFTIVAGIFIFSFGYGAYFASKHVKDPKPVDKWDAVKWESSTIYPGFPYGSNRNYYILAHVKTSTTNTTATFKTREEEPTKQP
jgi:hypothetical protein